MTCATVQHRLGEIHAQTIHDAIERKGARTPVGPGFFPPMNIAKAPGAALADGSRIPKVIRSGAKRKTGPISLGGPKWSRPENAS